MVEKYDFNLSFTIITMVFVGKWVRNRESRRLISGMVKLITVGQTRNPGGPSYCM